METFLFGILIFGAGFIFLGIYQDRNKRIKEVMDLTNEQTELAQLLGQKTVDLAFLQQEVRTLRDKTAEQLQIIEKQKQDIAYLIFNRPDRANSINVFSQDELKKIRFMCHPDKHNGKTHELFIKINGMIK